jgi:hypothetical protein
MLPACCMLCVCVFVCVCVTKLGLHFHDNNLKNQIVILYTISDTIQNLPRVDSTEKN